MSTRASILVTDGKNQRWFYRNADGYPAFVGLVISEYLVGIDEWNVDDISKMLLKERMKHFHTGYKVTFKEDFDINEDSEYVYIINCKCKNISCYIHRIRESFTECNRQERLVMYISYPPKSFVKREDEMRKEIAESCCIIGKSLNEIKEAIKKIEDLK